VLMFSGYPPDRPMPAVNVVLRKPHDIPILLGTVRSLLASPPTASGAAPI
jgi:hypothetical protein